MKFIKDEKYLKIMPENLIEIAGKIDFIDDPDHKRLSKTERAKLKTERKREIFEAKLKLFVEGMTKQEQEIIKFNDFTKCCQEIVQYPSRFTRFIAYFAEIRVIIPANIALYYYKELEIQYTNI